MQSAYKKLEIIIGRLVMEHGKTQILTKGGTRIDVEDARIGICISSVAVPGEKDFGLSVVELLPRQGNEVV